MAACLKASSDSRAAASVASAAVLPFKLFAIEVKDLVTSLQAEATGLRRVSQEPRSAFPCSSPIKALSILPTASTSEM